MIVLIALISVCLMSYYLIICEDYDDGVIGRLALGVLSFTSGLGFVQCLYGKAVFDPVSQSFFVAVAIFEGRHIYRIYKGKTQSKDAIEVFRRLFSADH